MLEVLFIKRSENKNDRHAGQIAFPGGHNEALESESEACVRETFEEIGYDLSLEDKFRFLGTLPKNYYVYRT